MIASTPATWVFWFLLVALPIFLEETTCSIYVVPLNSLQADLDARFRARGISSVIYDSLEWRAMSMSERCKQIILVNYFHAVKGDFAKAIKSLPLVTRIIFDEANTIQDFNSFMLYNSRLVELAATFSHAQLVFMSATLSARKLHQLLESFQLLESQPLIFEVLSYSILLLFTLTLTLTLYSDKVPKTKSFFQGPL